MFKDSPEGQAQYEPAVPESAEEVMSLVDAYTDAFHVAIRPDGGIQFAEGILAKAYKDKLKATVERIVQERDSLHKIVAVMLRYYDPIDSTEDDRAVVNQLVGMGVLHERI